MSTFTGTAQANAPGVDPSALCFRAAQIASRETQVPFEVLVAIAKTETGRTRHGKVEPWPWTINTRGQGAWLSSQTALLDAALKNLAAQETSFDIGCFQINYKWHHRAFDSIDAMIDPTTNARYAAGFLRELFDEFGTWKDAAGAYHSRTEEHAARYKQSFSRHYNDGVDVPNNTVASADSSAVLRVNKYPLLQARDGQARLGSLMLQGAGATQARLGGLVN